MASLGGDSALVELFLRHGANPARGASWKGGDTPLHKAASGGHIEIIRMLIEASVDPNIQNSFGETPLHHAARFTRPESVEALLHYGANPNLRDHGTGIFRTARSTPINVIGTCRKGDSGDYLTIFKSIVNAGIDPNSTSGHSTPLVAAIWLKSKDSVEFLLDNGADINATHRNGSHALTAAASSDLDMVKLLIERGIDLSKILRDDRTALDIALEIATRWNQDEIATFLERIKMGKSEQSPEPY